MFSLPILDVMYINDVDYLISNFLLFAVHLCAFLNENYNNRIGGRLQFDICFKGVSNKAKPWMTMQFWAYQNHAKLDFIQI